MPGQIVALRAIRGKRLRAPHCIRQQRYIMTNDTIIDDQQLAALLAGNIHGPEHDELLARLATDDGENFHAFARTAATLREMEEEDAEQHATRRTWKTVLWAVVIRAMARLRPRRR